MYAGIDMLDARLIPLVAARFKALGDPGRLAVLSALHTGESHVSALAKTTRRSQPNVSQQLASLQRAGLVASRRDGTRVLYRLADRHVERLCAVVCDSVARSVLDQQRLLRSAVASERRRA